MIKSNTQHHADHTNCVDRECPRYSEDSMGLCATCARAAYRDSDDVGDCSCIECVSWREAQANR